MFSTKRIYQLFVLVVIISTVITACATATPIPAPTQAPVATTAPVATVAPAATDTPAAVAWKATIRPATKKWKIGYGDGLAGIPFTASVTKSINDVAKQMGVEIVYCDNAYNQEKTVECSNSLVTQKVDGVIFANWIAGTEQMVADIFHTAKIPCVTYDGPHPGCVAFGPDNYAAGLEAGKFLGDYAKKQGWDPKDVSLITVWTPDVPVHKARADGAKAGVKGELGIADANIYDVGTKDMSDVQGNVTAFLTGHPNLKYVLCFGHSDQPGVDCGLALEQAGYRGKAAAASLGASTEALVELRKRTDAESIFKASISYFPERYGEYLVPAIVDLLEGVKVPDRVIPEVSPVTRDNVNQLYPAN
jgi:ribose transport system substrate-binding protein